MTAKIAYILLIAIIIADILTSIAFNLNWSYWNFGVIVKTPIEFYLLMHSIRLIKSNLVISVIIILFFIWLIGITICYFNSNILLNDEPNKIFLDTDTNIFTASFTVFNRYIFFFALSIIMYSYSEELPFIANVKRLLEYFIIANSVCIIMGFIFNIDMFSSYNPGGKITDYEPRFGYKGILYGINEITGVFFLGISHFYREVFFYKKKKKIFYLLLVIFSSFLTGAKGTLIGVVLLTSYYLYKYFNRFFKFIFFPVLSISIFILVAYYSGIIMDILSTISTSDSIWTVISSGRSDYIVMNLQYITSHWHFLNYLFGDGSLYTETDLFDLYFFFGLGSILYLFFYTRLFMKFEKTTDKVSVYLLMLLLAFSNGHMIQSAVFPVFLIAYLISSGDTSQNLKNENSLYFNGA